MIRYMVLESALIPFLSIDFTAKPNIEHHQKNYPRAKRCDSRF
jgi:hypothetical protein